MFLFDLLKKTYKNISWLFLIIWDYSFIKFINFVNGVEK